MCLWIILVSEGRKEPREKNKDGREKSKTSKQNNRLGEIKGVYFFIVFVRLLLLIRLRLLCIYENIASGKVPQKNIRLPIDCMCDISDL